MATASSAWTRRHTGQINVFDAASPFGGYKQSGWGREMGHHALSLYTEVKSIWVDLTLVFPGCTGFGALAREPRTRRLRWRRSLYRQTPDPGA